MTALSGKLLQSAVPASQKADLAVALEHVLRHPRGAAEHGFESGTFSVDESWLVNEPAQQTGASIPIVAAAAHLERELIERALAQSRGRVGGPSGAAAKLGIPRQTLDSKIAVLGIRKHQFLK